MNTNPDKKIIGGTAGESDLKLLVVFGVRQLAGAFLTHDMSRTDQNADKLACSEVSFAATCGFSVMLSDSEVSLPL